MGKQVLYPEAKKALVTLLAYLGDDPYREGLKETPDRVLKSYSELFSGYRETKENDPERILKTFEDGAKDYDELILLKGVEFCSTCEHHLLPFSGVAHIAYIPDKKIVGISKLARLLELFSRRLQVQERLTTQITSTLDKHLRPLGSACVIEATHSCMSCRGVKKFSTMVTSSLSGVFRKKSKVREEFMNLIKS